MAELLFQPKALREQAFAQMQKKYKMIRDG
jgi:hypothetical protein